MLLISYASDMLSLLIRTGNGTSYSRITAVAPGTTLEYVASAFNGWQAVKIGSQVGWVSGEFSEITSE
jgi:uncharacterized protein YraI